MWGLEFVFLFPLSHKEHLHVRYLMQIVFCLYVHLNVNQHIVVFFIFLCQFDAAKLRKLRPSFKESGGSVTAGNASSIRFIYCHDLLKFFLFVFFYLTFLYLDVLVNYFLFMKFMVFDMIYLTSLVLTYH